MTPSHIEHIGIAVTNSFAVDDTDQALNEAKEKGVRLIDQQSRPGAEGLHIGFLHPKSTLGVLTELCCK